MPVVHFVEEWIAGDSLGRFPPPAVRLRRHGGPSIAAYLRSLPRFREPGTEMNVHEQIFPRPMAKPPPK